MPFFGNDFFSATEAMSGEQAQAYLRCIWHYWHHTHCTGLRDDSDALMRLCRCPQEDWKEWREVIFDNDRFFTLGQDEKWHQVRAAEEWKRSMKKYQGNVNKTKAATEARKKQRE